MSLARSRPNRVRIPAHPATGQSRARLVLSLSKDEAERTVPPRGSSLVLRQA